MALILADRVKETTTTTGTATYTLAGASTGFESFASIGDGNTTYYACTDGTDFEVGIGTYTASGTTLARTTILQSSNSDSAVSWSAGTKTIFCCQPAEKAVFLDASGNIATFNGSNLTNVNATTLDSLDSTQFLRSDADDNKTSGNLTFEDNIKARFGTSGDLQIYHDGSNSFINDVGTGSVVMRTNGSFFQFDTPSTVMAKFIKDGAVELRHNNNLKFETTSTGATVTGVLTADGLDLGDDEPIRLGASQDLTISHDGSNSRIKDVGTGSLLIGASFVGIQKADGSETAAKFFNDGSVELYHDNSKKLETTSTGATITGTAKATTKFEVDGQTIGFTSNGATSGSGNFGVASSNGGARINADSGSNTATFVDFDATNISASGGDVTYRFGRGTTEGSSDLSQLIFYGHDGTNSPVVTMDSTGAITANQLNLGDNERLRIGASPTSDLQIWHDGTNSNIVNGTGSLIIADTSGDVKIQGKYGEQSIVANNDGSVELYHDNSKKLETTSTGATTTGQHAINNTSGFGALEIGGTSGAFVDLKNPNSDDYDIRLITTGTGGEFLSQDALRLGSTGTTSITNVSGNSTYANFIPAGAVELFYSGNKRFETTSSGAEVTGDLTLTSTDAGATENPTLDLYRNSASPADNDVLGHINFTGENDADEKIVYAEIESVVSDVSDGSEDSKLNFRGMIGGSQQLYMSQQFGVNYFYRDILLFQRNLIFEGATSDDFETTLTVTDPTSDNTIQLPDSSGTVLLDTGDQTLTGDLKFPDNEKALFGTSSDFQVYHNASNSYIDNYVGDIYIRNGTADRDVTIQSDDGSGGLSTYFQADGSTGSANLFHYGSIKLYTGSNGVDVVGDLTITSTDAGATENPTLDLYRNSASPADNDVLGHINFTGENDAGEKITYAEIQTSIADASDGTEGSRLQLGARYNGTFLTYYEAKFGLNTFNRDAIFTNDTNIIFEGATNDGNETTLTVADPTSDNTIQLPDASGTVALQEQAYQAINAQTGTTYTTVLADGGKLVTLSNASAITLTIPPNASVAYPVGTKLDFIQIGAGQVTVAGGTGVTVNSTPTLKFRAQHSGASCIKIATDTWQLVGDLAES